MTVGTDAKRASRATIRVAVALSMLLTAVFFLSFGFSEEGIAELQRTRKRVQEMQSEITDLQQEKRRLEEEIESLRKSTFAVERIAREDLGMSRPGETIYMIEEGDESSDFEVPSPE